jgi:hypothetical protein
MHDNIILQNSWDNERDSIESDKFDEYSTYTQEQLRQLQADWTAEILLAVQLFDWYQATELSSSTSTDIQGDPFEMSQKESKTLQKRIHFITS